MVWKFIALLAIAVAAPESVTVTKLDGATEAGKLQSWSASEVVVTTAGGPLSVPVADLVGLEISTHETADTGKPLLELTGGTCLPIENFRISGKRANARLAVPGAAEPPALKVPLEQVHAVRLLALDTDVLPQWQEIRKLAVTSDLVVVSKRGGKSLDHLECVLGDVTDAEVTCEIDGQQLKVPLGKVAGLVYYRPEDANADVAPCVLAGPDGLRIAANDGPSAKR